MTNNAPIRKGLRVNYQKSAVRNIRLIAKHLSERAKHLEEFADLAESNFADKDWVVSPVLVTNTVMYAVMDHGPLTNYMRDAILFAQKAEEQNDN